MLFSQPVISHLCSDTALGYLGRLKIPTLLLFPKALQTLTPTYCRNLISVYVLAHNLGSVSNLSLAKPSVPSGTGLAPIWWNSLPYEIHEIQPADAFTALLTNVLNLAAPRFAFLSVSRTVSCSCYYATGEGGLWNTVTYGTRETFWFQQPDTEATTHSGTHEPKVPFFLSSGMPQNHGLLRAQVEGAWNSQPCRRSSPGFHAR